VPTDRPDDRAEQKRMDACPRYASVAGQWDRCVPRSDSLDVEAVSSSSTVMTTSPPRAFRLGRLPKTRKNHKNNTHENTQRSSLASAQQQLQFGATNAGQDALILPKDRIG
jgi:hypothetical protein